MNIFSRLSITFLSALLVIVLVSGGASVCFANSGGSHGKTKEEAKNEAKSKKKEAVSITGGQSDGDLIFLHLAALTLPIINDYGAQQLVTMLIDLQMSDLEAAENLRSQMPRLKDAVLQALYGGLADGSMRNAQALDLMKIKKSIQETLNRIFGDGKVQDVLIQAVSQRKL
ncbi:MAG: hypothetical protein PHD48_04960 [Alphaproteobacteria bacterium]|nr:hypothetical protein [Alphaproteobacteria bacterium]